MYIQRRLHLPELVRGIDVKHERVGRWTFQNAVADAGDGVGRDGIRQWNVRLRQEVCVSVPTRIHIWVRELDIRKEPMSAWYQDANCVEHSAVRLILIETQIQELPHV